MSLLSFGPQLLLVLARLHFVFNKLALLVNLALALEDTHFSLAGSCLLNNIDTSEKVQFHCIRNIKLHVNLQQHSSFVECNLGCNATGSGLVVMSVMTGLRHVLCCID